jgi:hypothetical protein
LHTHAFSDNSFSTFDPAEKAGELVARRAVLYHLLPSAEQLWFLAFVGGFVVVVEPVL